MGAHLFNKYYALWNRYYILYDKKVYPVVLAHNHWYIFQKKRNPGTEEWEGGTATHIASTVFQLNPDLDLFEGDLLRTQVIKPLEEELDLLTAQIHEAPPDDEPEPTRPASPRESDASIPEPQKRMSAVTITPTQSTIAMALAHRTPFMPTSGGSAPGPAGGGGGPSAPVVAPTAAATPPGENGRLEGKEPTTFMGD